MNTEMRWVQAGYWVPALADFVIAVMALIPQRMGVASYVYPMGLMASAAFSWGVLLLIAAREPVARRWILPPTMLVVALVGGVAAHAGFVGLISTTRAGAGALASIAVLSIMTVGYRLARSMGQDGQPVES